MRPVAWDAAQHSKTPLAACRQAQSHDRHKGSHLQGCCSAEALHKRLCHLVLLAGGVLSQQCCKAIHHLGQVSQGAPTHHRRLVAAPVAAEPRVAARGRIDREQTEAAEQQHERCHAQPISMLQLQLLIISCTCACVPNIHRKWLGRRRGRTCAAVWPAPPHSRVQPPSQQAQAVPCSCSEQSAWVLVWQLWHLPHRQTVLALAAGLVLILQRLQMCCA